MTDREEVTDGWCKGRRALLAGAGATGLVGMLAACGSDPSDGKTTDQPANPTTDAATTAAAKTDTANDLATTGDIPVQGGKVVGGVLIVQPVAGTFKAFSAACPHKGVMVGAPVNGVVTCPAHKSTFNMADGARLSGPATQGLNAVQITVQGGEILKS